MTRIDELDFPHTAALYRSDGSGVALIRRQTAVGAGPTWAQVAEAGAGLAPGYLYVEYHAGDAQVWSVEGGADAALPQRAHLDPRLTSLGAFFEQADAEAARREAAALHTRTAAANADIRTQTFQVAAHDGDAWTAAVGPTLQGVTSITLTGRDGHVRHLETRASRDDLERARTAGVVVEATETVGRPWFDLRTGRTHRTVTLTLGPAGDTSGAPA